LWLSTAKRKTQGRGSDRKVASGAKVTLSRNWLPNSGPLSCAPTWSLLWNRAKALHLSKQAVKAVVRQALREPQLIADLKKC
jgi:hypothetical protein